MSWIDRLKEASYTSPKGEVFNFDYEDVSLSFDKKTTAFEFANSNNTYVQDNGNTSRRYPLRIFFWGTDYDIESEKFLNALEQKGIATLSHPMYGIVQVIPFGTITRRDDLKTAGNQAIFEITFFNTINILYPNSQNNTQNVVINSIEEYNTVTADNFGNKIDLSSEVSKATFKNGFESLTKNTGSSLNGLVKTSKSAETQFNTIQDSILGGLDSLVDDPKTLISQANKLIQLPSKVEISFLSKLNSYGNLINTNVNTKPTSNNEYQNLAYYNNTYLTGLSSSAINNTFDTKNEAIEVAILLLETLELITNWSDDISEDLSIIDTGESYQKLQETISLTAGFLVELSFSLKQERSIILDRDRTLIDLSYEIYGEVDNQIDFLINSNKLSGNEILELPKGKEILYYV